MAGYNFEGDLNFRNATIVNSQADLEQSGQRAKFSNRFQNSGKGVADMNLLATIFSHPKGITGANTEQVWSETVKTFQKLDISAQEPSVGIGNPDFDGVVRMDYKDGMSDVDLSSISDKPHQLGPNTHVPSENTFNPTVTRNIQGEPREATLSTGGYGFKIERNFRSTNQSDSETLGRYFSNHYNPTVESSVEPNKITNPIKGEFVDSTQLGY